MLRRFSTIRTALEKSEFIRNNRHIVGHLVVSDEYLDLLTALQEHGHVERSVMGGKNLSHLPETLGHSIQLTLNPGSLPYYEDLDDLVSYTVEEPPDYYVHGVGEVKATVTEGGKTHAWIVSYRQILTAKKLLHATADFDSPGKVTFLTPEKIEIPLEYSSPDIPSLVHLGELQSQLTGKQTKDPADFEQRLVLFRKSLREYLRAYPPEDRFKMFLKNFETIYDSYSRDYQLWVGNTFGELEKSFEEKRLKFVADLNGILAGVQASILAVPITAILLGDKYDPGNPLKDFLLAMGVLGVGVVALRLLQNQKATLEATREAINATKSDFEKKQSKRKAEFATRLENLDEQETRVRHLLSMIRGTIILIVIAGFAGWLYAANNSKAPALTVISAGGQKIVTDYTTDGSIKSVTRLHPDGSLLGTLYYSNGVPTHANYFDEQKRVRRTLLYRADGTPVTSRDFDEHGKLFTEEQFDASGQQMEKKTP